MMRATALSGSLLLLTLFSQATPALAQHGQPCPGGFCPLDNRLPPARLQDFHSSGVPEVPGHSTSTVRTGPHSAITLAIRLEFATEILAEEVLYLADFHRRHVSVESLTNDLVTSATHVRESVEQGETPDHLLSDLRNISTALGQLERFMDLRWNRPLAMATDRVVLLQDNLAAAIENGPAPAPGGQQPTGGSPDGPFFDTAPPPLPSGSAAVTIPSDMEGI